MHSYDRRFCLSAPIFLLLALAIGLLASAMPAIAAVPAPVVSVQGVGSYSVSYKACSSCYAHGLEEQVGTSGAWQYIGSGTQSFQNRSPGTYRYRVVYALLLPSMSYQLEYGATASVVVDPAAPPSVGPSLAAQLEQRYSGWRADIDGDGVDELLLRPQQSTAPAAGVLGSVLIDRTAGGPVAATAASAALAAQAGWRATSLEIGVRDVNVDGFADLVVRGTEREPGLALDRNQIVFAPGSGGSALSLRTRGVDAALERFTTDITRHLVNPEYYPNNAPIRYAQYVYYTTTCTFYGAGASYIDGFALPWPCMLRPIYYYFAYRDYSVFHPDAMYVASYDYGMLHGVISVDHGMPRIRDALSRILGVTIGGWDADDLIGPADPVADEAERIGIELFVVLAGIGEAVAQEAGEGVETATTDRVLIKGRRVLGRGPMHSALEYRSSTISAYDSDSSIWVDGLLVSEVNWPRDHPALTMRLGYVDGPLSPAMYWSNLLLADGRYDDDLQYDLFPSLGQGGYNSNSYTSGLIGATLGRPTISMQTLVGGERPVPASEFN